MLSEFRNTNVTWDKATSRIYSPVTANESDENGRKLVVHIVNGGQVEDLTGAALHLYWITIDKLHTGLDVFKAVDLKKGEFELSYTTGMLSNKGVLNANLVLVDTTGRVVSERFRITVKEGIDNDAIQSENSFSSLTQALIEVGPRLDDITAQLQQKLELADIANLSSATPLFANNVSGMTDTTKPYVNMADGYIYLYLGGTWTKTTVLYQGTNYGATTMDNIIKNPLFTINAYWGTVLSNITIRENESLTFLPTALHGQIKQSIASFSVGDILYSYVQIKSTSNLTYWDIFRSGLENTKQYVKKFVAGTGNFEAVSARFQTELNTNLEFRVLTQQSHSWEPITLTKPLIVNLTAIFGKGNEPELDDFEEMLQRYNSRIFFPDTFTATVTPARNVFPLPLTAKDIDSLSTNTFGVELSNGVITIDTGYIKLTMGKRGPNNIFDFNQFVVNGIVSGVNTDFFGPYVVRALQNINGDNPSSYYFTGGNHSYNNSGAGVATGRTSKLQFYIDGTPTTAFSGRANTLEITWKNRVQAFNTTKVDGTGREVLEEEYRLSFDGLRFSVTNNITPLEEVEIVTYYGLQAQYGQWNDTYRFVGGLNRKWTPSNTHTNSGNKQTSAIVLKSSADDILEIGINKNVDLGSGEYTSATHNAFTSNSKAYYRLINELSCTAGDIYTLEGYYKFYKQ